MPSRRASMGELSTGDVISFRGGTWTVSHVFVEGDGVIEIDLSSDSSSYNLHVDVTEQVDVVGRAGGSAE